MSRRLRHTRHSSRRLRTLERLETRQLLANMVGDWQAFDLGVGREDGNSISSGSDSSSNPVAGGGAGLAVLAGDVEISEFMASNETTLSTRTRSNSESPFVGGQLFFDWIELTNLTAAALDIGGLHLTDSAIDRKKWQIPVGTILPASGQLLLFASGRNILDTSLDELGSFHTNFNISAGGEFLAITDTDGTILQAYSPAYPVQFNDISFGFADDPIPGYFTTPTPGLPNGPSVVNEGPIVADVTENPGVLSDDLDLVVTAQVQPRNAPIDDVDLLA